MSFDKKAYQRRLMRERRAAAKKGLKVNPAYEVASHEDKGGGVMVERLPEEVEAAKELQEALCAYPDGEVMTSTDRKFEKRRPNYFVYDIPEAERRCHQCFRKFKTRLGLLKFCSPKCQRAKLESLSTTGIKLEEKE